MIDRKPPVFGKNKVSIVDKPKDFKGTLTKLLKYMKSEMISIIIAIVFTIGSVAAMVILPEYLGDATDVIISNVIQNNAYKKINDGYAKVEEILNGVDEIKKIVTDGLADEETSAAFSKLTYHDKSIGYLVNEANDIDSIFDEETKAKILNLPEYTYKVQIRKIVGYYYDGEDKYLPITKIDMTFGEYIDLLDIDIPYGNIPQEFIDYFLSMKVNSEDGYPIINAYKQSNTIGDFVKALGFENSFNVSEAYKKIIYDTTLTHEPVLDWDQLINLIEKLVILIMIYVAFSCVQSVVLAGVAQRLSYNLREDINRKINKIPLKFFDKTTNGEIMSLIVNDVDTISTSLNQSLPQLITSIATILGVLIMMLRIAPILTLIAIVCIPISLILMRFIVKKSQKYFEAQQQNLGHVNGEIEEAFTGHNVVKLFCQEDSTIKDFDMYNEKLAISSRKSQFLSGLMQPLSKLVGNSCYVAVCIFGGMLVIKGSITIGSLQSFVQYMRQFTQPVNQISSIFNMVQSTIAAVERVFNMLEVEEEKEFSSEVLENVNGNVTFKNIGFGYDEKMIINDFSVNCKKGQKIAIVGQTGAGKTTIVKLLMRFYDVKSGEISIDGNNINMYTRNSVRKNIGMVLQDSWLFNGSIMNNIRFGKLDATDSEVINAAKIANVDLYISKLEGKYDYVINSESNNISQGQKQLITIARAILANNKILILDEATSSVDTMTEKIVQKAMDQLICGKTCFIIAHRLSTITNADNILVMDEGDIVEQGTHEELMRKNGYYTSLYKSQFVK